jgi:hypothetical protein
MLEELKGRFKEWRRKRKWNATLQLYHLRVMVQADNRWMAHNRIVSALTGRYLRMLDDNWESQPQEEVSAFRERIGLSPHNPSGDTYPMPEHGWTCFHCGETFTTPGAAREHFGPTPNAEPGCVIKVQLGGERGLLNALRKAEQRLAMHMDEDTELARAMHAMQSRHADVLIASEEAGYARGLRDGMAMQPLAKQRWDAIETLMVLGDVELTQTEDGGYGISLEPAESIMPQYWEGKTPEEAIDQVIAKIAAAPLPPAECQHDDGK